MLKDSSFERDGVLGVECVNQYTSRYRQHRSSDGWLHVGVEKSLEKLRVTQSYIRVHKAELNGKNFKVLPNRGKADHL